MNLLVVLASAHLAAPPFHPAAGVGFRRDSTRSFTITQGPANHRVRDAVVVPGAPQWVIGKFAYGEVDKDLKEEDVELWVGERAWRRVATYRTTREGGHATTQGVVDDGGRVYAPLEPALPIGAWPLRFHVRGDGSGATGLLVVTPKDTPAVVFDIDGTITVSDGEVFKEIEALLERRSYEPKVRAGAAAVAQKWAERGYLVVYLTARPDNLRGITTKWLAAKGFPPGPVFFADRIRDAVPGEAVAAHKRAVLARLAPALRFVAGYGNASTDVDVYREAGIPEERRFVVSRPRTGAKAIEFSAHEPELLGLPRAAHPAPQIPGWP